MNISMELKSWRKPEWNLNLELPEADQVQALIEWPLYGYENDLEMIETAESGMPTGRGLKSYAKQMVSRYVPEIKGLPIAKNGKELIALPDLVVRTWTVPKLKKDGTPVLSDTGEPELEKMQESSWDLIMELSSIITAGQDVSAKKNN